MAGHMQTFRQIEAWLLQWDRLRADGRTREADVIASRIRGDVDRDFATFERASKGDMGIHAHYLSVSALGFSTMPAATPAIAANLGRSDVRLVGNALIALGVKADPNTPDKALLVRVGRGQPAEPMRYAPLALAKVLDARTAAGRPVDEAFERQALARLGSIVVERDPIVRLHVAKALGALRIGGTYEYLSVLTRDPQMRVRWASAAALARSGDERGFPEVVRLLHDVPEESQPIIQDVLISYAHKLQGRPLSSAEIQSLGVGPRAWTLWFTYWKRSQAKRNPATSPRR